MSRKRSVVIASVLSGALFSASAAFAVATGLLGSSRADAVGSFQTIEARAATEPTVATRSNGTSATTHADQRHDAAPSASGTEDPVRVEGPRQTSLASTPATAEPDNEPAPPASMPGAHEPSHEPKHHDDAVDPAPAPTTSTVEEHHDSEPHEVDPHRDDSHTNDGPEADD
jgi:hypothetical protein